MNYMDFWRVIIIPALLKDMPMGIIYLEEQILQWHVALVGVVASRLMASVIMALAIIYIVRTVFLNDAHPFHRHHHIGILHHVWRFIVTIGLAWFFLIYGVVAGNNEQAQHNATTTYTYRRRFGRMFEAVNSFTRVSLHFRLGRALYRMFYRILNHIHFVEQNNRIGNIFGSASMPLGSMEYPLCYQSLS